MVDLSQFLLSEVPAVAVQEQLPDLPMGQPDAGRHTSAQPCPSVSRSGEDLGVGSPDPSLVVPAVQAYREGRDRATDRIIST